MMNEALSTAWLQIAAECRLWAIAPGHLESMASALASGPSLASLSRRAQPQTAGSGTAIIPIVGPLVRRSGPLARLLGLPSYSDIRAALAQAVADRGVERIVLFVDSPGGSAMGAEECAAEVAAAAKIKPVLTFVDGLGASAALWIGSQANKVVATPSSEVGSVGVIAIHADLSKALRSAGVQMSMVVSKISPLKAEGNPYEPLGTEARKRVQADVDAIASRFVRDVAKGRRMPMQKVIADFGHGRTMFADAAQSVGMVDGVAGTIAGALQVRLSGSQSTAAALARRRRLRLLTMSAH